MSYDPNSPPVGGSEAWDAWNPARSYRENSKPEQGPQSLIDLIDGYREMGLSTIYVRDEPGKFYSPRSHQHEVRLFGLGGSSRIRIGEVLTKLVRDVEVIIPAGMKHEAIAGLDGAEYLFAYPKHTAP